MLTACLYFHGFALSPSSVLSKRTVMLTDYVMEFLLLLTRRATYKLTGQFSTVLLNHFAHGSNHSQAGKAIKIQATFFCHKQGREKSHCASSRKMKAMAAISGDQSVLQHAFPQQAKKAQCEEARKYFLKIILPCGCHSQFSNTHIHEM